ncbi:MAG: GntR family transcriptional regulator [Sedimentisphaerales bacterium]
MISIGAFKSDPVTEIKLAKEFNVSRTPIRDALKVLEKDGIVERRQRKGVYLKEPTVKEISDLYDVRLALEGFVAKLATDNATDQDIEFLMQTALDYEKAIKEEDEPKAREADLLFHSKLMEISGNELLTDIMKNFRIMEQLFKVKLLHKKKSSSKISPHSHLKIVEAIRLQDANECERLVKSHILHKKEQVIESLLGISLSSVNVNFEMLERENVEK